MPATVVVRSLEARTGTRRPCARVAVGIDGSYWGDMALTWAIRHASATGAELRVVNRTGTDPLPGLLAASAGSRLLVLGCRGEQHRAFGLGALVLPVARSARCDTVVVRGLWSSIAGRQGLVTALVSGGDQATAVLRAATAIAKVHGSALQVLSRPDGSALDAVAHATDSDILVVGRDAGTVMRFALHHAPCPVLVVRQR
ncbi:universal stress protein [Allokutzneria sp. A3M-2-11 16]|uniref:universal stress protein n=1 Tax=Allokutzneria sp. A3M-2-11 16 TaxID=2962043 RepID=UPI0020B87E5C|nr:universal stress protein [Allokutzneria sp. A3M-2-11 16]MCP3804479.1 universal stress protein [Allokutzneria sp. A3M-2-11 16]